MEKRKTAFVIMGPHYAAEGQHTLIETERVECHFYAVDSYEKVKELVKQLDQNGFGAIEFCAAFGPEKTRELAELVGNRIPMAYVTPLDEDHNRRAWEYYKRWSPQQ